MKAWEHHFKLQKESPFKDLKWRAVGPEFQGGRIAEKMNDFDSAIDHCQKFLEGMKDADPAHLS